uniref:Uncharacterized protein n=1 Tax=Rhabditophanes sp. KR3021 TaxID=114890 RepID=A0AC35TW34_9BILA
MVFLFFRDISSWICMGLGILFLIIVCCLICSPCICTLCAGSIAALGLGKSRKSKSKNNQTAPPPTIITTQSYPPPQQHQMAAPPAPVQSYPVPLEQKNITIYESGTKPVPRERKEVRIREASSMSEDGRYYTVRRNENHQGLMRSPPRADKIVYTHQNERYYNGTRN